MQFQSTRPSRGETGSPLMIQNANFLFQSTRPSRGETIPLLIYDEHKVISIHSPLAGRDQRLSTRTLISVRFQSTRPSRGETHAGLRLRVDWQISIHSPLAGRDQVYRSGNHQGRYFNPLAPRGARRGSAGTADPLNQFQSTRPSRGETFFAPLPRSMARVFQSTRPSRGETNVPTDVQNNLQISIHSPLAGRDLRFSSVTCPSSAFQSTRPSRGETSCRPADSSRSPHFNPLAPRGARHSTPTAMATTPAFQSTRPSRGET